MDIAIWAAVWPAFASGCRGQVAKIGSRVLKRSCRRDHQAVTVVEAEHTAAGANIHIVNTGFLAQFSSDGCPLIVRIAPSMRMSSFFIRAAARDDGVDDPRGHHESRRRAGTEPATSSASELAPFAPCATEAFTASANDHRQRIRGLLEKPTHQLAPCAPIQSSDTHTFSWQAPNL